MNILTDTLPQKVRVGNKIFEFDTDFRAGIAFELMIEKGIEDNIELLTTYFGANIPNSEDISDALNAILWFYCCGAEAPKNNDRAAKKEKAVYSFEADKNAIFADFWQYYRIDLSTEGLHWFIFRSLLMGLPEESGFKKRIYYRTCDLKDLPKKEQARIRKIREQIKLDKPEKSANVSLETRNNRLKEYVKKRSKEVQSEVN